jgi:hypothetical protein
MCILPPAGSIKDTVGGFLFAPFRREAANGLTDEKGIS